jgi:hypothetical protein
MDPRPAPATWIPVVAFALAIGAGAAFQHRQVSSGRASLYEAARRLLPELRRLAPGAEVGIHSVSVEGDVGRTTLTAVRVRQRPFGEPALELDSQDLTWRRLPGEGWIPEAKPADDAVRPRRR